MDADAAFAALRTSLALCTKCGEQPRRPGQRWCKACHAAYVRIWRQGRPRTQEQRMKEAARHKAGVYLRRGKITRQPCHRCGSSNAEMHHPDYNRPLDVEWLCRACHLAEHADR